MVIFSILCNKYHFYLPLVHDSSWCPDCSTLWGKFGNKMFSCPPRLLCHILLQNQNEQHSTLMNAYMRLTTMCRAYTYVIFYFSLTGWKNLMNSTDLVFHTVNEKSKHAVQNFYLKRWYIFGAKIQIENLKNYCTKINLFI